MIPTSVNREDGKKVRSSQRRGQTHREGDLSTSIAHDQVVDLASGGTARSPILVDMDTVSSEAPSDGEKGISDFADGNQDLSRLTGGGLLSTKQGPSNVDGGIGGKKCSKGRSTSTAVRTTTITGQKNQPKRRRSSGSVNGGASRKLRRLSTGGSSKLHRHGSSGSHVTTARSVRTFPVIDDEPLRLVTPLLENPTITSAKTVKVTGSGTAPTIDNHQIRLSKLSAHDVWQDTDISFSRPDTYSIAYMARLLGFYAPPLSMRDPSFADESHLYRPIPWNPRTPFARELEDNSSVYSIPPAGNLWARRLAQIRKNDYDRRMKGDLSYCQAKEDAMILGEARDPLYDAILRHGRLSSVKASGNLNESNDDPVPSVVSSHASSSSLLPVGESLVCLQTKQISPSQLAKFRATANEECFSGVFQCAVDCKILPETDKEEKCYRAMKLSDFVKLHSTAATSELSSPQTMSDDNNTEGQCPAQELDPVWSNDTTSSSAAPEALTDSPPTNPLVDQMINSCPPSSCGILLLRGEIPVAWATYSFQWYPYGQGYELVQVLGSINDESGSLLDRQTREPRNADDELHILLLTALVLEHCRISHVWYSIFFGVTEVMAPLFVNVFRMTHLLGQTASGKMENVDLLSDLHRSSTRYAFLTYQRTGRQVMSLHEDGGDGHCSGARHRWLARLPNIDDVKNAIRSSDHVVRQAKMSSSRKPSSFLSGAPSVMRQTIVHFRARPSGTDAVTITRVEGIEGEGETPITIPSFQNDLPIDVMRGFEVRQREVESQDEILGELVKNQNTLKVLEEDLEPRIRSLMMDVVLERSYYEGETEIAAREAEKQILSEFKRHQVRRKEMDQALQEQLEIDMEAVCAICNDGEVTPDNQIVFCEICSVAVHQMCYGIDRIPAGDYYCIPCRYYRLKSSERRSICCELCPMRDGAFIQSDVKEQVDSAEGKWVHAVCAKWQGLNFARLPDLLEDVTDLKVSFRRNKIACGLCLGERGCMNKCRVKTCTTWVHVTCARAVGTCTVVHGEDVNGPVKENPWSLLCPEHSQVKPEDVPEERLSVERLIELAKAFPPEPKPPPIPINPMPFNTATGEERRRLLVNKAYERELLVELTTKKIFGLRCEVCDQEVDAKLRKKCNVCGIVFCSDCSLECDGVDGPYRCEVCSYVISKRKMGENTQKPQCVACYQKWGWLRSASAHPVGKRSHGFRDRSGSTMFGKQMWAHTLCSFWHPKLMLSLGSGKVDCSQVVVASGRGLIQSSLQCFLCGQNGGLKVRCSHDGCAYVFDGQKVDTLFHVTCARQAGFEVNAMEGQNGSMTFFVKCYRHGGNEYNLRAKLEDLLEIEKRRAGKMLSRQDAPMKFAHASRLLFSAIGVLRILGWAWRWAEFWVDYNSSWEPLLEPGEDEEKMTKEELKIVDSTRDSRCLDARNCRLAAFGAALRNRSYDEGDDYQREAFNAALTSILETKSLVGPLTDVEKEFFTQWISLAYWSKSRYLCFGEDKVEVNEDSPFVVHAKDKSPKFKLSSRSLPGTASGTSEVDDFLLRELMTDDLLPTLRRGRNSPKVSAASTRRSSRRHETGDSPNECSSPMIDKAAGQMNDIMEVVCVDEDIPVTPLTKES